MQPANFNLVGRLVDSAREKNLIPEAYLITGVEPVSESNNFLDHKNKIYNTLIDAAISSPHFRSKIFEPDYPMDSDKISAEIDYMNSPRDINTTIRGGLHNAVFIGDYVDKYCILTEGANILDFGCGSLRVSRYFMQFARQFVYFSLRCKSHQHKMGAGTISRSIKHLSYG